MPKPVTVTLALRPGLGGGQGRKALCEGLSTVLQIGQTIWLGNDESASVERLTLDGDTAADHVQFHLGEFLDLPAGGPPAEAPEIDIEGMDFADGYLWVVGSHSLKRCKVETDASPADAIKALQDIDADANRFVLGRIPVVEHEGTPTLLRKDPPRRAQQLQGGTTGNALTRLLRKDKHLAPFIGLPGKENGFDIEGLAVAGDRLFLGLRGPVLRGWAVVLELRPIGDGKRLQLEPLEGRKRRRVRKHFLQLDGLGVRDLCRDGDDLLVLAGPTMSLDGPVRVLRWKKALACEDACVVEAAQLELVLELPFGRHCDHAEGVALFRRNAADKPALLVVYDSPSPHRRVGKSGVCADVFQMPRR